MANTEMIREYIRASGYKLQYVARAMQISPNALGQKLQGHTQFKLNEAERLSAVLGLSMYERDLCFFEDSRSTPYNVPTNVGRNPATPEYLSYQKYLLYGTDSALP